MLSKPVKQAVNKDRSSIGRKEILLSYRMCGKAVKEEIIRPAQKNPQKQNKKPPKHPANRISIWSVYC